MGTSVRFRYKASKTVNGHIHNRVESVSTRAAMTFFLMTLSQVMVNISWIVNSFIKEYTYLRSFSFMMLCTSGIWNVIIYYFRNRVFKNEMNRLVFHLRSGETYEDFLCN